MSTILAPTFAELLAENEENLAAVSKAGDAVAAIEYAARDEIAANPVTASLTYTGPKGQTITVEVAFVDGKAKGESVSTDMALRLYYLRDRAIKGESLTDSENEAVRRFNEASRASKERAAAIRERVYRERGYEAAKEAKAKAEAASSASGTRLWNAPVNTMTDAIAVLEFIKDVNAEWDGLGERALAFIKEREPMPEDRMTDILTQGAAEAGYDVLGVNGRGGT